MVPPWQPRGASQKHLHPCSFGYCANLYQGTRDRTLETTGSEKAGNSQRQEERLPGLLLRLKAQR